MKNFEISSKDYQLYLFKSLLWLSLAWGGFALTLVNFFHAWIAWSFFLAVTIYLTVRAAKNNFSLKPSKEFFLVSLFFLIVVSFFSYYSTPTVFTGRDQGSFTEAAIRLSQNHQLEFSTPTGSEFFKLHEPGRALNFPGFYYTNDGNLVTQFSLAYITWLALFFSIFGIVGLTIANAVLLFSFFISFYLLSRLFLKTFSALPTTLFAVSSFVFMWFSKMTLSENIALPLLWTSIFSLMLLLKNPRKLTYLIFLLSTFLLCFARIEGIAFLLTSALIIFFNKESRQYLAKQTLWRFLLPAGIFLLFFALNFYNDFYFYKEIAKAILPDITSPKAKYLGEIKNYVLPDFYIQKVFYLYGLLGFFILGAFSIIKSFWKKEFYALVPFFVTLPSFIYFIDDQISPDHPWLLRRFMFSLAPVAIFYSGLLIGRLIEKKKLISCKILALPLTIGLLVGNMPAFLKYINFSENQNLLSQTETLSQKFSDNDLVLVDQRATGDNWSMISGPLNFLYGKNAVYFFNIQDLARLDTSRFENIYLITPNSQISYYRSSTIGPKLNDKGAYIFNSTKLETQSNSPLAKISLPEKKTFHVDGRIFKIEK